jgi:hypothetical protein
MEVIPPKRKGAVRAETRRKENSHAKAHGREDKEIGKRDNPRTGVPNIQYSETDGRRDDFLGRGEGKNRLAAHPHLASVNIS